MGFKALTVNTAAEAAGHIYAEDDAAIFQSMFGGDGVLNIGNCLKSTVISNNKVRISDGVLSVGGHIGRLSHADYQDMTIENGATGYNRNDIIYARFLTSGNVDSFILAVKKGTATTGTASDPALVQGNLYDGAVERDYPLYRVKLSGLSIASVDQLFTVIPTIPDLKAQMAKDKAEINQSLIDKSMNALFTVKTHGDLTTSGYYTLTSIPKNFGSNDIYVDQYGDIIFKKTGHYMLNISLVLDKNFTSTLADISVHRYDSTGGSDTLISEHYFYAANNVHTGNVNILIPITAYGYLKIYCFGKVQGGYISLYRVE